MSNAFCFKIKGSASYVEPFLFYNAIKRLSLLKFCSIIVT